MIVIPDAEAMRDFGKLVGKVVQPGDLIMLNGPLGAGKTTIVQGLAKAMDVAGRVQSPTFVIAVVHRGKQAGAPDLVHVDAYRLDKTEDLDALDLDTALEECVTVVEWGAGKTEVLTQDRIVINIERPVGSTNSENIADLAVEAPRQITIIPEGKRWGKIVPVLEIAWREHNQEKQMQ